ncbi:class I SAM-dependent methyltransferase [Vulgatibacter incomptus]|uniref:Methyltransferase n=1 Tax=Vulgatibacter incomptus TaxID=1391653 RepID=A0A0K1PFD3_9BACT|nr:class I SAM-dependent methyltransferase [Vulgatibacter incomptus]AKU92146.1 Methyltransferase [Vulgatibacter incomptus]
MHSVTKPVTTGDIYDKPLLYDIAFSYRDFPSEVDALAAWYARVAGKASPGSVIELACGPADHAVEWDRRGAQAAALDLSKAMCEYAVGKASLQGAKVEVFCADMIDFALERRFDLALLMINSVAHIHTVEAMVRHLRSVAAHLEPDGVYVLELQHPRDFVGRGARPTGVSRPWRVERFGLSVETRWGSPDDPYDPVRQLFEAHVEIHASDGEREEVVRETCTMRDWGYGELEAAVKLSGAFEIAELHGDFLADAPFDESSWRMIVVLRRSDLKV